MAKKKHLQKKNMAPAKKITNEKTAPTNDIQSKTIFQNPLLCSQFLRNYVDHPMLKNIRPEDIDVLKEWRFSPSTWGKNE